MPAKRLNRSFPVVAMLAVACLAVWLWPRAAQTTTTTTGDTTAREQTPAATAAVRSTPAAVIVADTVASPAATVPGLRQHRLMPMHAGAISPLSPPLPFDAAAYARDPEAYLRQIDHSRVYQVAAPGPGVTRLQRESPMNQSVDSQGSVIIAVRAQAHAPVTFVSFDRGAFSNGFTAITVKADQDGLASARFTATEGTFQDTNIKAGSPMHAGNVDFVVTITPSGEDLPADHQQENPL
jgi:hypothetical protein